VTEPTTAAGVRLANRVPAAGTTPAVQQEP